MDKKFEPAQGGEIDRGDWFTQFRFLINPSNNLTCLSFSTINLPYGIYRTKAKKTFITNTKEIVVKEYEELFKKDPLSLNDQESKLRFLCYDKVIVSLKTQLCINKAWGNTKVFIRQTIPPYLKVKVYPDLIEEGFRLSKDKKALTYQIGTLNKKEIEDKIKELLKAIHRLILLGLEDNNKKKIRSRNIIIRIF